MKADAVGCPALFNVDVRKTIGQTRRMDRPHRIAFEERIAAAAADFMRSYGARPPVQMHMFFNGSDPAAAYVGSVTARPALPGDDTAAALAGLGDAAAAMCAARLIFSWEDYSLRADLMGPGSYRSALVTADVDFVSCVQTWRYFRFAGAPGFAVTFDAPPFAVPDNGLPGPLARAVSTWTNEQGAKEVPGTLSRMADLGYGFRWANRRSERLAS